MGLELINPADMAQTVGNALIDAFDDLATDYQKELNDNSSSPSFLKERYNMNKVLLKRKWAALFLLKISESYKDLLELYYTKSTLTRRHADRQLQMGIVCEESGVKTYASIFPRGCRCP
jgi:hypothetical protein